MATIRGPDPSPHSERHPPPPDHTRLGFAAGRQDANDELGTYSLEPIHRASEEVMEEAEALLGSDSNASGGRLERSAVFCLLLQHLCSTFTTGLYDFGAFLFLAQIFPDSLVPASLVGLSSTLTGLVWSGRIGGLVDTTPRLRLVRSAIGGQKALYVCSYGLFLLLFTLSTSNSTADESNRQAIPAGTALSIWAILGLLVVLTSALTLFNTGLTVAFERDWVTTIAQGDDRHLTFLNTWVRRIDLCSKLSAPLVVSLLTTFIGYRSTCLILLFVSATTLLLELFWVHVVYNRFPALAGPPAGDASALRSSTSGQSTWKDAVWQEWDDWKEFSQLPIFYSSLAIASIYLTTLSYDGTFLTYLHTVQHASDSFIAAMRGVCILTGLAGTLLMPFLESLVGLERAGAWSIWFEVGCLGPVVLAFFLGAPLAPLSPSPSPPSDASSPSLGPGKEQHTLNSLVLFGGIALSRIGLWSFDLCQLKELQLALSSHPRRNRLTALQLALQNLFDLLKYVLTLSAGRPDNFKWTALVSWGAVAAGGTAYSVYLRKVRGHLIHWKWIGVGKEM